MKTKLTLVKHVALLLMLSALVVQPSTASAQGTIFTYQGSLNDNGSPANGTNYGMVFYLYDAPTNGNLLGNLGIVSVSVSNGVFTVPLDFGTNFPGADRWLEITVQKNGGGFSTLAPRQKLSPTPYAITAANVSGSLPAAQLTGTIPAASIAGPYTSAITLNNPANNFTGAFIGNGAGLTNIPTSGSAWQLTGNAGTAAGVNFLGTTDNQPLELHVNGVRGLRLEPTAVDVNHSGIVNVVGGSPANYVAPGTYGATISGGGAVNYLGLSAANSVSADFGTVGGGFQNAIQTPAQYATIGGGWQNTAGALDATIGGGYQNTANNNDTTVGGGALNSATGGEATVGGGDQNIASDLAATVAGGRQNQATRSYATVAGGQQNIASGQYATVSGGYNNTAFGGTISGGSQNITIGDECFVGGGNQNTIQTNAEWSAIGGGQNNTIRTNAEWSTIGGGTHNTISMAANASTIGGGGGNMIQLGVFDSVISGGFQNTIQTNASYSAIGGGANNAIQGSGNSFPGTFSTIGGGLVNIVQANAPYSTIGGGDNNAVQSNAIASTISGGGFNLIQTNTVGAFIGGGSGNTIQSRTDGQNDGSAIVGGMGNTIGTNTHLSFIGGGQINTIAADGGVAVIVGGEFNTNQAGSSTIGGGIFNSIQTNAFDSVIAGGSANTIMGTDGGPRGVGTIGGGAGNIIQFNSRLSTIGGGYGNMIQTSVSFSTISGGTSNAATGNLATVPGGDQNVAGTNSLAAGHRAKATNTGAFVWADSTDTDFATTADNQFLIRASGGVGIGANNPDAMLTVNGTADKPGGGAWTVFSDARLKKNIEPLTGALNRLLELRAVTFEYKEPQSIHELPGVQIGMIAQEVEKIFPDWVDTAPNGMKRLSIHGFEALTVQALRELRAEKDAKISDLEKANDEMQKQLAAQKELNSQMAARFDALEKTVNRLADQPSVPLAANQDTAK